MAEPRRATFGFTKLVVDDLEKMTGFYTEVYGLSVLQRLEGRIGPEPVSEVTLGPADQMGSESLTVLKYRHRAAPAVGEAILGFVTADLDALIARAYNAGGRAVEEPRDMPERGVRVGFVADPEGHLAEVVELLG